MPKAVVTLTIAKAEGLVALNPGNTSNPYFTATIGMQAVTTPTLAKSVNPVFDATFVFHDCPLPAMLTLRAFNKIDYVDVEDPLGTATVTLLDLEPETITKVVQLGHGGNAALAQRAPNGCGAVTIRYNVVAAPEEAASTTAAAAAVTHPGLPEVGGVPPPAFAVPIPMPLPAAVTPIPVPAANSMNTSGAAPIPVAVLPQDSRAGTPGSRGTADGSIGSLMASNPIVANPTATAPMLLPMQSVLPTPTDGVVTPESQLSANLKQHSGHTPPSLQLASAPASAKPLVANTAPAPPVLAAVSMTLRSESTNGYETFAVPGAKQSASAMGTELNGAATTTTASMPQGASAELYYANNSAGATAAAAPPPCTHGPLPSPNSLAMLPVATNVPVVNAAAVFPEFPRRRPSGDESHRPEMVSTSIVYSGAAQVPVTPPQLKPLAAVTTQLSAAPTPACLRVSQAPSLEGSRLPSAEQLPASMTSVMNSFPAQAPSQVPPHLFGALPVAKVPPSPSLQSSASNSHRATPASMGLPGELRAGGANPFPSVALSASAPAVGGTTSQSTGAARRGVAPVSVFAGVPPGSAAFPNAAALRPGGGDSDAEAAAALRGRCPRRETGTGRENPAAAASLSAAAQMYADSEYLFEAAASGADVEVFRKLREVDPYLMNGFLRCVDYSGRSLLHIAAWNGQLQVLQTLLSSEPAAPMIDLRAIIAAKSGNTILHAAASGGQAEVAQWLRYSHPTAGPLLLSMHNARGMTAAECAMEAGFSSVARLLLPS